MIEILGTELTENALIGDAVGAFVGGLMIASTLYIVGKVKQKYKLLDEKNAAMLAGEEYPSWKLERLNTWYKGYKLGLIECLLLSFFMGAGAGVLGAHLGWVQGAIELGALAGLSAIVAGIFLDKYIIHPIANGKFMEQVETPLIEKFLGLVTDAPEVSDEDLKRIALELKKQGKL